MSEILELPVSTKYAKSWNVGDALREIMANAIDEAARKNSQIGLRYEAGELLITNEIGELKRENFVMGGTDKEDKTTIGQFGEGLKVGAMVLLRNGRQIRGESGSMGFAFHLTHSKKWNSEIMEIELSDIPFQKGTRVFVHEIKFQEAQDLKKKFLCFRKVEPILSTKEGSVYDGEGELFTHGVLIHKDWARVKKNPQYSLTFNLANVELNRDRSIFSDWRVVREIGELIYQAGDESTITKLMHFWLHHEKMDDLTPYNHPTKETIPIWQKVIKTMFRTFNNDKFAVAASEMEMRILREWGYNAIFGPSGFRAACEQVFLFPDAKEALGKAGEYVIAKDINSWEQRNLTKAEDFAKAVISKIPGIHAIEHRPAFVFIKRLDEAPDSKEPVHLGVYKDGTIGIRRSQLIKEWDAKQTMLHEYVHSVFGHSDNTRDFENDLERAWRTALEFKIN